MKLNKNKESRKTTIVLPEPTYRRTKVKGKRERPKGKKVSSLESKVWERRAPLKLELDTQAEDGKYGHVRNVAFMMLLPPTSGDMSHILTCHER